MLRSELDEESWSCLSRLLRLSCTKQEWIFLWFEAEKLAGALALAAPSEFHHPLEIVWLLGGFGRPVDPLRLFQLAVEKAKALGAASFIVPSRKIAPKPRLFPRRNFARGERSCDSSPEVQWILE